MDKAIKNNKKIEELIQSLPSQDKDIRQPGMIEQRVLNIVKIFAENYFDTINNLTKTIDNNSKIGRSLSRQLIWLNTILTILTLVGTIFVILTFLK